jgi:hypothetical protein
MKKSPSQRLQETNYKAKLFYIQKQEEQKKKFGVCFNTDTRHGEVIQEFHDQELKNLKLYGFYYNSCIWESAAGLMSIHLTKEGAQKAMRKHKAKEKKEWKEMYSTPEEQKDMPFGTHEAWFVDEIKVKK